jgi:hypothetical protein
MKRLLVLATFGLGAAVVPAAAQEDFSTVEVTVGVAQKEVDTDSSKFLEYQEVPNGGTIPALRFQGRKGDFDYDFLAKDAAQDDQQYRLRMNSGAFRVTGSYTGTPHKFGNGGRSLLGPVSETDWRLSDTTQAAYQGVIAVTPGAQVTYTSLSRLVQPGLDAAPPNIDLKLQRNRGNLALSFLPKESAWSVNATYLHERRSGTRAANGTSFGFGNVVETPEPLRYITQDFGVNAAYQGTWGTARAGVRFNDFKNSFDTFVWDNPFRSTDSTDPSAYQSPGSQSKNGPVLGAMALPPDNKAVTEAAGVSLKLGSRTRLSADVAFGQWSQNEDRLLPWTTNTAIVTPDGRPATTAPLPAATLDGKIATMSLSGFLTTKLGDDFGLHARYRFYDHDNQTPRYRLEEGYVRFDAVWEEIRRITVPYGFTSNMLDAYVTYGKGIFGLEAGFKRNGMERTFRETSDTTENVFRVAGDLRGSWYTLRGLAEFGSRDYDDYHAAEAEEHSFLDAGLPVNQTVLRRYDQARRDLRRFGITADLAPGSGNFSAFASYVRTAFEYDRDPVPCEHAEDIAGQAAFCPGGTQTPLGMIEDTYDSFTLEASYTAGERVTAYAFYTYENGDILQDGRQSGGSLNFNPADVWTANITNKGNTFAAGADLVLVPDKWTLGVFGRYQEVDGTNDLTLLPGYSTSIYSSATLQQCVGTSGPCAIPAFDDTKLTYVQASLGYRVAKRWAARAGLGYEKYEVRDSQTKNTLNYMPASFFLQADNRDYRGWIGHLSLTYSNQ